MRGLAIGTSGASEHILKAPLFPPVEHRPTYTTGRRDASLSGSVHPEEAKIQNAGAEFAITKRGGQVTYHGPGQLVGYPILDLGKMGVSDQIESLAR